VLETNDSSRDFDLRMGIREVARYAVESSFATPTLGLTVLSTILPIIPL
jgi:hypothetical protein